MTGQSHVENRFGVHSDRKAKIISCWNRKWQMAIQNLWLWSEAKTGKRLFLTALRPPNAAIPGRYVSLQFPAPTGSDIHI